MEQEIFDDYIWNEHKKILTADKHKIPWGLEIFLILHLWHLAFRFLCIITLISSSFISW